MPSLNSDGSVNLFIRALACYARIEAMKAENSMRLANNQTPAYDEKSFAEEADFLEMLWREG